MFVFILKFYYC